MINPKLQGMFVVFVMSFHDIICCSYLAVFHMNTHCENHVVEVLVCCAVLGELKFDDRQYAQEVCNR